jgi:DNA topoisomerase VI subunit A
MRYDYLRYFFLSTGQVPSNVSGITNLETNATHILVVEKDAVYQSLLDGGIIEKFQGQLILITVRLT